MISYDQVLAMYNLFRDAIKRAHLKTWAVTKLKGKVQIDETMLSHGKIIYGQKLMDMLYLANNNEKSKKKIAKFNLLEATDKEIASYAADEEELKKWLLMKTKYVR